MANKYEQLIQQLGFTGLNARKVSDQLSIELHMFDYKDLDQAAIEAVLGKPFFDAARIIYKVGNEGTISIAKRNKTVTYAVGLKVYNDVMNMSPNHPNYKHINKN